MFVFRVIAKFVLIVILGTTLFVDAVSAQDERSEAYDYYEKGLNAESFSDKIKFFEKALEIEPYFVEALYQLGVTHYHTGNYEEAIKYLGQAKDANPELDKQIKLYLRNAYTFVASKHVKNEDYELALSNAREALSLDDRYAQAHTVLGDAYFRLGELESAIKSYKQSVELNENQAGVWNELGDTYLSSEAYHKAVDAYETALSLDPDLEDAKTQLRIAETRNLPENWLSRFEAYRAMGEFDKAHQILKTAHSIYPGHDKIAEFWKEMEQEQNYRAATLAIEQEDWASALELLQKIDPEYKDTALKLAEVQDLVAAHADSIASDQEIADIEIDSAMTSGAEIVSSGDSVTIDLPVQSKPDTQSIEVSEAVEQEPETVQAQGDFPLVSMDSLEAAPITQAEDSTTWQEASKPIASPNDGDSNLSTSRISSDGFSSFYWIAAILAGILIVVLVILKRNHTNKSQPRDDSTHDKTVVVDADQNDDMFKDEVASVTPVRFDSLETSEILDEEDENKEEDAFLAFKDTQTILGGIKKVQRIGRYILEKEIGRGSMGLIYKAWDPKLDRTVVIKQVSFDFTGNPHEIAKLKDRLFREARAAGRLNHENIVIIYDVDEEKNFSYIVMEYLEGSDLKMRLEKGETFDLPRTIKIIKQVCSALEFAHDSGIVHRDIKPSNIILTRNDKVKVADFGIAKLAHLGTLTQTGSIVGTPFYMSPEQVEGRKLDGRSDIFSVGVILYEMLTSKHPFEGDNITTVVYKIVHKSPKRPSMINRDLPSSVDAMVQRACAKNPKHRYTNAGQLFADLNKLEGELS